MELVLLMRNVQHFSRPGIQFKDITALLKDARPLQHVVDRWKERFAGKNLTAIVAPGAAVFVFGGALAYAMRLALIPVRKEGKLPHKTRKASYALEYGTATVEIHEDAVPPGARVLIVDDLLATGGTLAATVKLVKQHGGQIVGVAVLIELDFLNGRDRLKDTPVFSLIHY